MLIVSLASVLIIRMCTCASSAPEPTCVLLPVSLLYSVKVRSWWRHQIETFSPLLAICAGKSPATGDFPTQMPVTRSFDVFFDLRLYKRLSKQPWGGWIETPSRPFWRHCNDFADIGQMAWFPDQDYDILESFAPTRTKFLKFQISWISSSTNIMYMKRTWIRYDIPYFPENNHLAIPSLS